MIASSGGSRLIQPGRTRASNVAIETSYDPLATFPREGKFAWAEGENSISDKLARLNLA